MTLFIKPRGELARTHSRLLAGLVIFGIATAATWFFLATANSRSTREPRADRLAWESEVNHIAAAMKRDVVVDVSMAPPHWQSVREQSQLSPDQAIESLGLEYLSPPQQQVRFLAPRLDWKELNDAWAAKATRPTPPVPTTELPVLAASLQNERPAPTPGARNLICRVAQAQLAKRVSIYQKLVATPSLDKTTLKVDRLRMANGQRFLQMRFPTGSLLAWALPSEDVLSANESPESGESLMLSSTSLQTAFETVAAKTRLPLRADPGLFADRRVTIYCTQAAPERLLETLAAAYYLDIQRTAEGWVVQPMPLRDYERISLQLVQQSQYYAQRRCGEFLNRLPPAQRQRLEKREELVLGGVPEECRSILEDAIRARTQADAVGAAMLREQSDLGEGVIRLDPQARNAPALLFRGKNISLPMLLPYLRPKVERSPSR